MTITQFERLLMPRFLISIFMAAMFMLGAGQSRIFQIARKPFFRDGFDFTRAAAQYINAVAVQYMNCPLAHVAGQHQFDALLGQCLGNIGFAAAPVG